MIKALIVPIAVLATLASILVPLPPAALDLLLTGNLLLALVLLVSTLYLSDPLKLSTLPTLLLLATMYRLALNISTTRLILASGDAGRVVEAFGEVVIQGNIAVGIVIFAVITLVQFIVIAKGSERVAEVSARFTLDAMPGKQMSIDADMRAGLIDLESAKQKRHELQVESRFYGALDGAMKFVKGDAIAGIIIVLINLAGGFLIGVLSEGLSISAAIHKYSILTVGDGLLAQIPALMCSLAAGMVVTRVVSAEGVSLGSELIQQVCQVRATKFLIGGLSLLLAFAPGIPAWPFLAFGVLLIFGGLLDSRPTGSDKKESSASAFQPKIPALLEVSITKAMARKLSNCSDLLQKVDSWRQSIYDKTGLILIRPDMVPMAGDGEVFRIRLRGVSLALHEIGASDPDDLKRSPSDQALHRIIQELDLTVINNGPELIDDIMTRRILDFFERAAPELVATVVPQVISVTQLSTLLRSLLREEISIKHFDVILQAISESSSRSGSDRRILEEVRVALARLISSSLTVDNGVLQAITIDPLIDISFAAAERAGNLPDAKQVDLVCEKLEELESSAPVLICSRHSRLITREALVRRGHSNKVVAHEEIVSGVPIKWLGTVTFQNGESELTAIESLAAA